jgi:putative transposase
MRRRGPKPGRRWWRQWLEPVLVLRRRWPNFGPRKLRHLLRKEHPRQQIPSTRTMARMLSTAGCIRRRKPRRPGPKLERPKLTRATRSNAVWTIDFKGSFFTGDGARCQPLTVRDLFSCYLLAVEHLPVASDLAVRKVLRRCFRRFGLPRVIRVDNGTPFGGDGARGLTSLSVWWTRLGIRVEFTRPAKPQDNGAHEQMHWVLKKETAQPPAANLPAQQRRFRRFRREYNEVRPHEKLGMRVPAEVYRPAPQPLPKLKSLRYPRSWRCTRVSQAGLIYWGGKMRIIGRAFKDQSIGLQPLADPKGTAGLSATVYLGNLLLGELHVSDSPSMRSVQYHARRKRRK